ncbi:MAG: hypothetical protein HY682_10535 [Chloroflexi bacterium]|nr:hypothetical protein [Chloroflexota bacterium]
MTLRIFGVNGDDHRATVVALDGTVVAREMVNRGREYKLTFTADQVGTYRLICADHAPSMQALITVLPSSS